MWIWKFRLNQTISRPFSMNSLANGLEVLKSDSLNLNKSSLQSLGNRFFKKEKIVKIISNKTINVIVVYLAIKMD